MTRILALNDSSLYLWEALGGKDFTTRGRSRPVVGALRRGRSHRTARCRGLGCEARRMRRAGVTGGTSGARAENLKGSMKLKRLISLLLLAIYLTAWGGPAYVSLSCKCHDVVACPGALPRASTAPMPRRRRVAEGSLLRQPPFDRNRTLYRVLLPITTRDPSAARSPTCRPHWLRRPRSRPSSSSSGRRFRMRRSFRMRGHVQACRPSCPPVLA